MNSTGTETTHGVCAIAYCQRSGRTQSKGCALFGAAIILIPYLLRHEEVTASNRVTLRMNFDERVWKLMETIPRGRVTTYGQIGRKLNTKAYRAVGNACRKNPYAPRVPCHRVVRSDGTVGGFGGKISGKTVEEKTRLLRKENVKVKNGKIVDFEKVLFRF